MRVILVTAVLEGMYFSTYEEETTYLIMYCIVNQLHYYASVGEDFCVQSALDQAQKLDATGVLLESLS